MKTQYKVLCRFCSRYLMTAVDSTIADTVICTGCKSKSNVKVVFASTATPEQLRYKSTTPETAPKKLKENK